MRMGTTMSDSDQTADPRDGAEARGQEWFRVTFDHAPVGMAVLDLQGRFENVNDAFCRVVARPSGELVGAGFDEVGHPGDIERHAGYRRRLLAGDRPRVADELRLIRPDGHVASTVGTWSVLPSADGSPGRFLVQVVDITGRRAAGITNVQGEELRERYERGLARSDADLAQFATVAAHDLRSPLQVITGFAGLLEQTQAEALGERGREFLGFILKSTTRMNGLIDDLLAYAKVGAEHRSHQPVPLDRAIDEVVAALGAELAAAGGVVENDPLPVVSGDPGLFVHLLHNLVANGLKFVAPGTSPRVRVSASRMVDAWCVDVIDNGIGIDPQHRQHVFGMFQRLHRNEYGGTGIGLAICRRIVEQRGGSLWVEDNPGGGSRFRFTVPDDPMGLGRLDDPAVAVAPPPAATGEVEPPGAPAPVPAGGLDVLLVEDDDAHARLVAETLAGADGVYHLRRVADLASARAELHHRPTDVILLDLFLPDGQGLDSVSQVTTLEPMVPVVIFTSLADEQLGLQAVHEGAQDYLVKGSVDGPRLARALRHAVERKALEARFAEQALHDPLTGLANRTLLLDRLRLELTRAGRTGGGVAVFYLDVDDFKAVNDRAGHDAGDEVLVRLARRLARTVRPGDTVGRIGGDEFVVVCGGLDTDDDVARMRARIEEAVGRPLLLGGGTELVTASVGVAVGRGAAEEPEVIIRRADEAMYEVKRGDR